MVRWPYLHRQQDSISRGGWRRTEEQRTVDCDEDRCEVVRVTVRTRDASSDWGHFFVAVGAGLWVDFGNPMWALRFKLHMRAVWNGWCAANSVSPVTRTSAWRRGNFWRPTHRTHLFFVDVGAGLAQEKYERSAVLSRISNLFMAASLPTCGLSIDVSWIVLSSALGCAVDRGFPLFSAEASVVVESSWFAESLLGSRGTLGAEVLVDFPH